jgi:hypothetical protein
VVRHNVGKRLNKRDRHAHLYDGCAEGEHGLVLNIPRPSDACRADQGAGQSDRDPIGIRSSLGISSLHQISDTLHLIAKSL